MHILSLLLLCNAGIAPDILSLPSVNLILPGPESWMISHVFDYRGHASYRPAVSIPATCSFLIRPILSIQRRFGCRTASYNLVDSHNRGAIEDVNRKTQVQRLPSEQSGPSQGIASNLIGNQLPHTTILDEGTSGWRHLKKRVAFGEPSHHRIYHIEEAGKTPLQLRFLNLEV